MLHQFVFALIRLKWSVPIHGTSQCIFIMAIIVGICYLIKAELSKNDFCILLHLLFFDGIWYIGINEIANYYLMPKSVKDQSLMMIIMHCRILEHLACALWKVKNRDITIWRGGSKAIRCAFSNECKWKCTIFDLQSCSAVAAGFDQSIQDWDIMYCKFSLWCAFFSCSPPWIFCIQ